MNVFTPTVETAALLRALKELVLTIKIVRPVALGGARLDGNFDAYTH